MNAVRNSIKEAAEGKEFEHPLMDYNNAAATQHEDVLKVVTIAMTRIGEQITGDDSQE